MNLTFHNPGIDDMIQNILVFQSEAETAFGQIRFTIFILN